MSNQLIIPKFLIGQRNFCQRINQNNIIISQHIDYLRRMILEMHKVYQRLCGKVNEISQKYYRKNNGQEGQENQGNIVSNFVSNINFIHVCINNQLNNNNVMIGTKTHKICKNRLQILQEKLIFADNLSLEFISKVNSYNIKQKKFRQNCLYFKDYEQDLMKYYALKANTKLYDAYSQTQLKLKQKIEDIIRKKDQYLINIYQIRITIKQFYEMEMNMINQYKKLILSIRKQSIEKSKANLPIIKEQIQDSYQESNRKSQRINKSSYQQKLKQKSIAQKRKQIELQYERGDLLENWFEDFLIQYRQQLISTGQRIDSIKKGTEYQKFQAQTLAIAQILPYQSLKDIESILNQVTFFRELINKIQHICGKVKVISELRKYRGHSYQKFIQDTNSFIQKQRQKNSIELKLKYEHIEQKYLQNYNEYNNRYIDLISQLQNHIITTMLAQNHPVQQKPKHKKSMKMNLFQKKHYSILMNPFFLSNQTFAYKDNPYLQKFSSHIDANKIQKMITLTGFLNKAKHKIMKTTCCGLVRREQQSQQPQLLDDFMCALKDDTFLLQGKLQLFQKYIKFSSSFNSKTLFGNTDIRIPIWDIMQFIPQKHLLSFMLHIKTTHGSLYFTSFLTYPFDIILQLYNKHLPSGFNSQINHKKQLIPLEELFQSQFYHLMNNNNLIIDKLNTYLSQNNKYLSICIEFHQSRKENTIFFQIKFRKKESELSYIFIHDENNKNQEIKLLLQKISTELINYQTFIKTQRESLPNNTSLPFNMQYSIIEQQQKNRISFIKEPSFMRKSRYNSTSQQKDRNTGNSASFLHLLSSKNFLTNNETPEFSDKGDREDREYKGYQQQKEELNNAIQVQTPNSLQSDQKNLSFQLKSSNQSYDATQKQSVLDKYIQRSRNKQRNKSKTTVVSKTSSQQPPPIINYKTILLILGILLGINLLLHNLK